ncbi:MAG: DUF3830 family protein [Alphaproteobacteria bacterium]|nr:DUF3830 family protein [Alphaproteobacteria bacterium]
MARYLVLDLAGAVARARMDFDAAPVTCRTVWDLLPVEATGGHAMQSGTNGAFHFDPSVLIPEENTTIQLLKGDVVFIHYDPRERYANPRGVSEVVWCYDRFNFTRSPGKIHEVVGNWFARLDGDWSTFAEMSARLALEGKKPIKVTRAEE